MENLPEYTALRQPNGNFTEVELKADPDLWALVKNDPVTALLLTGQAQTAREAETRFLNENVDTICQMVLELVESNLSNEEFGRQPLVLLLRGHGSRRWEDSLL